MKKNEYLELLKERAKTSRVYKKYQLTGLMVAQILNDEPHKALYIKLAKLVNGDILIRIAKEVAEREKVKNKGAYFMSILNRESLLEELRTKKPKRKNLNKNKFRKVASKKKRKIS